MEKIWLENQQVSLDAVFNLLTTQKFADWYNNGNFNEWITDKADSSQENKLKEQLLKMMS